MPYAHSPRSARVNRCTRVKARASHVAPTKFLEMTSALESAGIRTSHPAFPCEPTRRVGNANSVMALVLSGV